MIIDLEDSLGKALTVKELAEYIGVSETNIRKNFQQYGGIKVGRHYRFFTKGVIDAIQKQTEKQIYRASPEERAAQREGISDAEGSKKMGSRDGKTVSLAQDRHGLLD